MAIRDEIKSLLAKRAMTMKKLAEKMTETTGKKYTMRSISGKLALGTLRYSEIELIAKILNYEINFKDLSQDKPQH